MERNCRSLGTQLTWISVTSLLCGGVGGSLKSIEQFKKSSATCKFRQGAKPKLECGLANTGVVFEGVFQHGVGIALLTLHF